GRGGSAAGDGADGGGGPLGEAVESVGSTGQFEVDPGVTLDRALGQLRVRGEVVVGRVPVRDDQVVLVVDAERELGRVGTGKGTGDTPGAGRGHPGAAEESGGGAGDVGDAERGLRARRGGVVAVRVIQGCSGRGVHLGCASGWWSGRRALAGDWTRMGCDRWPEGAWRGQVLSAHSAREGLWGVPGALTVVGDGVSATTPLARSPVRRAGCRA